MRYRYKYGMARTNICSRTPNILSFLIQKRWVRELKPGLGNKKMVSNYQYCGSVTSHCPVILRYSHFVTFPYFDSLFVEAPLRLFLTNSLQIRNFSFSAFYTTNIHPVDCVSCYYNKVDVCVSVHSVWNWREIPTWCNNLFIIINNSTCFGHLYAHLQECSVVYVLCHSIWCSALGVVAEVLKSRCVVLCTGVSNLSHNS